MKFIIASLIGLANIGNNMPVLDNLPNYVVVNSEQSPEKKAVLRIPAKAFTFPLSEDEHIVIATLVAKYDSEENMAGLAAPQVGLPYQAIVFAVYDDPALKKWRPDLEQTIPKTIWLNPGYEAIGNEKSEDYEGCFSVQGLAGLVKRYKTIRYSAYDLAGNYIEGIATGFLARVIQHEVDHLQGKLFIDYVAQEELLPIEEYRRRRAEKMNSN